MSSTWVQCKVIPVGGIIERFSTNVSVSSGSKLTPVPVMFEMEGRNGGGAVESP